MKTIRRDTLLKKAKAGKLFLVNSYNFDDMYGLKQERDLRVPVRICGYADHIDGYCNLFEFDFTSSSGRAYLNDNGTVHLRVHSNCFMDFEVTQ